MKTKKVHYIRVSTLEQKTDRQKTIIFGAMVYEDKCSGVVPFKERSAGGRLIKDIEAGEVNEVHVHSIDRLGRNTLDIMQTIQYMTSKRVNVISIKEGLNTLNADGSENMVAKMIIGILGTLSEFERERMKERQREGIDIAKERGNYKGNGRPQGSRESKDSFLNKAKAKKVVKYLEQKRSIRETAKLADCSIGFVQKVKGYL
jgi:DNA invertase Pin-like site-specific DNA recombinase